MYASFDLLTWHIYVILLYWECEWTPLHLSLYIFLLTFKVTFISRAHQDSHWSVIGVIRCIFTRRVWLTCPSTGGDNGLRCTMEGERAVGGRAGAPLSNGISDGREFVELQLCPNLLELLSTIWLKRLHRYSTGRCVGYAACTHSNTAHLRPNFG